MANKPADTKRVRISKAQQITMLEVLVASLILGTCIVVAIFLIKYIKFNTKIIAAKNDAISAYDQTIRNVGVCADTDRNGRLNDKELEACSPNAVALSSVPNSLRYNVFQVMAQNADLESVARKRSQELEKLCYDAAGNKFDFNRLVSQATSDTERERYLQSLKACSALRVIPDALPARKNTEALMASLNQIFIESNWEPENISPRDDRILTEIEGVEAIPVSMRYQGSDAKVLSVLYNIEKSIREFDIVTATVEWNSAGLSLNAQANAYYLAETMMIEGETTVRAKGSQPTTTSGTRSLTGASSLVNGSGSSR